MPRPIVLTLTLAATLACASAQTSAKKTHTAGNPKATAAAPTAPTATVPASCTCPASIANQRHYPPYIGKQKITTVRTLSDGTTVTNVVDTSMWRDALGRMRTETSRPQPDGTNLLYVTVNDPIANLRLSWSANTLPPVPKVVNVYHYGRPTPQAAAPATPQVTRRYFPRRTESLPPQTIDGIYVEGSRITTTTPAGYEGNDRDITATIENWISPDLGIELRSIQDDPRIGKVTREFTDFKQTDPDPSLFQLPAGYEIKDTNP